MIQIRRIGALVVLLALLGASTLTAGARGVAVDDASPQVQDAKVYAADVGISVEEAVRRLSLQEAAGKLSEALETQETGIFGGLWIQHTPDFRIVVQLTQGDLSSIRPYVEGGPLAGLVEVRRTHVSLARLEAAQATAIRAVRRLGVPVDAGLNVMQSRAELYVRDRLRFDAAVRNANIALPEHVEVLTVDELSHEQATLYGGLSLSTCTSGFAVRNSGGTRGITTAAHCGNAQSYSGTALTFQSERYTGAYDVQWHTHSGSTFRNWVFDGLSDTSTPYYRTITATKSRTSQALNEFVCKYGKTTAYTCGYISDKSYLSSSPSDATATYIRVHRDGVNLSEGGDSGGPWFASNTAYGIHHSGIGDDATYMAINYISTLGLTVLTQ